MRRTASLLATAALLLAACAGTSSSGDDPKETLRAALAGTTALDGLTATLELRSTPESLQALAAENGDRLSAADAQRFLASSVTLSGTNQDDPEEAAAQVIVNVAGDTVVELRVVDRTLYARADVSRLLEIFGKDPALAAAFAQQAGAGGLDFVEPFMAGEWLVLSGLDDMAERAENETAAQQHHDAAEEFLRSLEGSTTVTSAGEDDAGEHLVAAVPLRELVRALEDATSGLGRGLPGAPSAPRPDEVPDTVIKLDVWVSDERVTQIEFDFLQLGPVAGESIPDGMERLALRITLEEFSGDVDVPPDAHLVDLGRLLPGMLGGLPAPAP